ncbi:NPCBM/NEW2 domain-containing protein [Actinacidiphila rubida]|uniref:galactosylceramidase n=1 Tax=Actinacidiphila rubida TaxID=310780 RepID=A0A1H8THS9_9ACTN|nr:NPCBM/NEW2 domain-containing protein [Actinacidiphila rubida]SEO90679.1 O-Glycosyl hydrolase [Actinacidiphila rubida]
MPVRPDHRARFSRFRRLGGAALACAALLLSGTVVAGGAAPARAASGTDVTIDDAVRGTGPDQFDYQGSGWGHASGEGAPADPYQGTNSWTDHSGDAVAFRFTGTRLTFRGVTDPGHGIGALSVDGGTPVDVDFYSAARTGDVALWASPELPDGAHTFTLTWTGRKNPASSGTAVVVDRVDFVGQVPPPGETDIAVDGTGSGRTFDGIGAISGGGGNSRLLIDYPEPQRSRILDYLFKPGYGASLQMLKLEIGGDTNSTDGSEPSIEHTKGSVNCTSGYEWWLMEQARQRNPHIKLYGLAWGAPGWIGNTTGAPGGGNFWSQDMIDYLTTWLGCAKQHGLAIDYLGGWNERGYDTGWYEKLHAALAAAHLPIDVVGADSGLDVAGTMLADPAFDQAVDIVGAHYPCEGGDGGSATTCDSSADAKATGKPLWASENGSQDDNTGSGALIRSITRGYLDGKFTAYLNWPLLAAIYPNLPYDTVGLAVAAQPWSGAYSLGTSLWATAQVTQVTQPGWSFIDSASGYLGGDRANGSFVTLKAPDASAYSTIVETSTAGAPQTAHFDVSGGLPTGPVHVWATDLNSTDQARQFVHTGDITPQDGHFSVTFEPGYVYSLTTTTGQGKGTAVSPQESRLALPYADSFDRPTPNQEARYLSDMQGSFETARCDGGRPGLCVRQMAAQKPIEWQDDSDAFALIGDTSWTDYTVTSDVYLEQPGTVELLGRAGQQQRPQSHQAGYFLRVADTGHWSIVKSTAAGELTTLAEGSGKVLGTHRWHTLGLGFSGTTLTAAVDGRRVGSVDDASYGSGQAGLGVVGYQTDEFDNLRITPVQQAAPTPATVKASVPDRIERGDSATEQVTFTNPASAPAVRGLILASGAPAGWTATPAGVTTFPLVAPGRSVTATWTVTAPTAADSPVSVTFTPLARYARGGVQHWTYGAAATTVPIPPPTGSPNLSDLSFVSTTNGWGPVERDLSNGEQAAGDGRTITLRGTAYAKGLGVHADSDVAFFLGGNCTRFTATVGVDDEVAPYGSVAFHVVADGKAIAGTSVVTGESQAVSLDADVTGARQLDLVVDDGGDGNAHDHADWAEPRLSCAAS